jgi:hypothetical protein
MYSPLATKRLFDEIKCTQPNDCACVLFSQYGLVVAIPKAIIQLIHWSALPATSHFHALDAAADNGVHPAIGQQLHQVADVVLLEVEHKARQKP